MHVPGELIDINRCRRRPDIAALAVRASRRGRWNQRQQVSRDWIGDGRALIVAQHRRVDVDTLSLSRALVAAEKEGPVPQNRAAGAEAELIPIEGRLLAGGVLK